VLGLDCMHKAAC